MANEKLYSHRSFLWEADPEGPEAVTAEVSLEDGDLNFDFGLNGVGERFAFGAWRTGRDDKGFDMAMAVLRKIHVVLGELIAAVDAAPPSPVKSEEAP